MRKEPLPSTPESEREKGREETSIEKRIYHTKEGVPIELACREFDPAQENGQEKRERGSEVFFFPGVGVDVDTKIAEDLGGAFAEASHERAYVVTTKVTKEINDSFYEQAVAIARFIREKGKTNITPAGHSEGGDRAIDVVSILQKDPGIAIDGLVLLDSTGLYEQSPNEVTKGFFKDAMVDVPRDLILKGVPRKGGQTRLSHIKKGMSVGTDVAFGIAKDIWQIWRKESRVGTMSRISAEAKNLSKMNPRMAEIEVPVVLISGTSDPISNPEKIAPPDEREEYLKEHLFPKSPYVKMVAPEKIGHHSMPFFRPKSVARASLYLLKRFHRAPQEEAVELDRG